MGYFSQQALDVEDMLFEGATVAEIAEKMNISVEQVQAYVQQLEDSDREFEYDDSMDGDAGSALASAGFGTDEDYGYYGDE